MATSEHKQFILTHKDTFSGSHLTKQLTGNRTDTSLSALCLPFSEIAAPAVIKPGSHFLSFCCLNSCKGSWVRTGGTVGPAPPPSSTSAGRRKPALPLPPRQERMQKWRWFRSERSLLSVLYLNLFVVLFGLLQKSQIKGYSTLLYIHFDKKKKKKTNILNL